MSELHSDSFQFFISPQGSDQVGDGSSRRPFATLPRAIEYITARHEGSVTAVKSLTGPTTVEVVSIATAGSGVRLRRRPHFEYFIDPLVDEETGEGTEFSPWASLTQALGEVEKLHSEPARALTPGRRLRIAVRTVFTSTKNEALKRRRETIARVSFGLMAAALVAPLLAIFAFLLYNAWPALSWTFLTKNPTHDLVGGGIWAPLIGTFYLIVISLLIAAPIGVLAGVYLNEYAKDNWFTRMINLAVVNLAGVPSIVHALFGLGAFVYFAGMGKSVLAACCTLAVMTLPVIITSTKEALGSVPMSFREACWNMGASRWQTIRTMVLPNSFGGILTGVILQVSRAAGESATVLLIGATQFRTGLPTEGLAAIFPYGLNEKCMALSTHLYLIAKDVPNVPSQTQYGTAVVLIGLVLLVNSLSIAVRIYLRSRKKW